MHFHRGEREKFIEVLSEEYPRAFFPNGGVRLPLKKNILQDLIDDGWGGDKDLLTQALDFYQRDFGYLRALLVGAERVNLDGRAVSKVTMNEHEQARRYMTQRKAELAAERDARVRLANEPAAKPTSTKRAPSPTPASAAAPVPAAMPEPVAASEPGADHALQLLAEITAALGVIRPVLAESSFAPLRAVLVGAALKDVAAKVAALASHVDAAHTYGGMS